MKITFRAEAEHKFSLLLFFYVMYDSSDPLDDQKWWSYTQFWQRKHFFLFKQTELTDFASVFLKELIERVRRFELKLNIAWGEAINK